MLEDSVPPTAQLPGALRPRRARDAAPDPMSVITVRGELDFGTVDQLCRRLDDHPGDHLTVDLSGATFYDQAAIDAVNLAASRARRAGRRITWINPPPHLADSHGR
jgi:anti-anti-sigma regulatory factor